MCLRYLLFWLGEHVFVSRSESGDETLRKEICAKIMTNYLRAVKKTKSSMHNHVKV